jgi:membrane associated rhomboid family serine protease
MSHAPSLVRLAPHRPHHPFGEEGEEEESASRLRAAESGKLLGRSARSPSRPSRPSRSTWWCGRPREQLCTSLDAWRCFEWTPPAGWAPQWPLHTLVVALVQIILFYATDSRASLELFVPIEPGTEWRILTLTLAHADAAHLWGNMVGTLSLVLLFEVIHGTPRTALLYWASGTFGSIAQVLLWRGEFGALLGASGAVYGVMGAYVAHLVLNLRETPLWPLWVCFVALVLVLEAVNYAVNRAPNVAYAAHGFGALYGAVLALCVARNVRVVPWERWFVYGGLVLSVVAGATAVALLAMRIAAWEAEGGVRGGL